MMSKLVFFIYFFDAIKNLLWLPGDPAPSPMYPLFQVKGAWPRLAPDTPVPPPLGKCPDPAPTVPN